MLIRQITNDTDIIDFVYDSNSNLVGYKSNGNMFYYVYDATGLIVGVVDSTGNLHEKYIYDSFGNVVETNNNPNSVNPFRYDGSYYDEETGFYYKNNRYYSPSLRIYLNIDKDDILNYISPIIEDTVVCVAKKLTDILSKVSGKPNFSTETTETFRIGARLLSGAIMAETIGFFLIVNTTLLPMFQKMFGEDFAKSQFSQEKLISFLIEFANEALPDWKPLETYKPNTGLRHLWFANMALGAPWAGYILNFERAKYDNKRWLLGHTNYTTVEGKYMWQSHVGYSWVYDFYFSLGGPIDTVRLPFENGTDYYIIWCWKGDYWNLGAGGEIGIYHTTDRESANNLFYQVDENLTVHARMKITYDHPIFNTIVLNEFHQTNWWITSFSPIIQHADVDRIHVSLLVRLTDYELGGVVLSTYNNMLDSEVSSGDWINFTPYNDEDERLMCVYGDIGCKHYNDIHNGFQFKIEY